MPNNDDPRFQELFARLVKMNRANGIYPGRVEPDGPVKYLHPDEVPMRDVILAAAEPISRDEVDKLFANLTL